MVRDVKEIETNFTYQVKHGFESLDKPESCYFFQFTDKVIFIKRSRRGYLLCASSMCGIQDRKAIQNCFDIIGVYDEIHSAVEDFKRYVRVVSAFHGIL